MQAASVSFLTSRIELVLLDRDGTINECPPVGEYVTAADQLVLLDGAAEAIAQINAASMPVIVVTNQRGVARGLMSEADVDSVHDALIEQLGAVGAHIDDFLVCPHENGTCSCRKPLPGLLLAALEGANVDPWNAVMIGDSNRDVEAGKRAGTWTIQLGSGELPSAADLVVPSLAAAVDLWLGERGRES